MNRNLFSTSIVVSTLMTACVLAAPACSSDSNPQNPGSDAGAGGSSGGNGTGGKSAGGTGGKSAGGAGGKAAGGAGGTAAGGTAAGGTSGAGGAAKGGAGGTSDTDGGDAGTTPLTPLSGTLLVAASDYTSNVGEVVTVDLATGRALGRAELSNGDVAASSSSGRAFALERKGEGAVNVLSATGAVTKRISLTLGDGGSGFLNPHSPLVVTGTNKAYVPLNAANAIAIVNLDAGTQTNTINLGAFLDPSDSDGSTEPDSLVYDAATHRAYFVLGRTDLYSGTLATEYTPACPPVPALIIAVDTTTDTVVDLNGDAGGVGIALPLAGPGSFVRDAASGHLLIVADGCSGTETDGGFRRTEDGIVSVDLGARTTHVLYDGTSNDYLDELLALGDGTYALSQGFGGSFHRFDPASPSHLGAAVVGVPQSVIATGGATLLGLKFGKSGDGGIEQEVVRYEVSSEKTSTAAAFQWSHDFSFSSMTLVN